MEHFADTAKKSAYRYDNQIILVEKILNEQGFMSSAYEYISKNFLYWENRHGYVSLNDFKAETGIAKLVAKANLGNNNVEKEELAYYLEYVLNILQILDIDGIDPYLSLKGNFDAVFSTLDDIIEKIGYQKITHDGEYYLSPKSGKVEIAAAITNGTYDLDEEMLLYNSPSSAKDLERKADILCRLYKYLESINDEINKYGFKNMHGDITKLINELDIRHAPSKKVKEILGSMKKAECIEWYDQLFNMCVSLIILVDYANKRKDITELKGRLG